MKPKMNATFIRCARIARDTMRQYAMDWRRLGDERALKRAIHQRQQAAYWAARASAR